MLSNIMFLKCFWLFWNAALFFLRVCKEFRQLRFGSVSDLFTFRFFWNGFFVGVWFNCMFLNDFYILARNVLLFWCK